jgi:hemerythrin-like domain-containing protein
VALKRLLATAPEDEEFRARATALKDLLQHHVEEEEDELFPAVQEALDREALEQLGQTLQRRYDEVFEAGFEAAMPKGWAKTSADLSKKTADKASKKSPKKPSQSAA